VKDPYDDFPYDEPDEVRNAFVDKRAIAAVLGGRNRPAKSGRALELAHTLQAADVVTPREALLVADAYMRADVYRAAGMALCLLGGYSIRPLAVLALESRADVRRQLLFDPGGVMEQAVHADEFDLDEALTICRAIEARLAAEEALR